MACLFCKIIHNEIPANIVYRDEKVLAFDDINPQAPIHKIIIPVQHIATFNDVSKEEARLLGDLFYRATQLAKELALAENGYRVVANCNQHGGQSVFHIHLHLLGGRKLGWPPG